MTLQSSGAISMSQINAEFGRGNNLNSYRGTSWYTDDGSSGTFSGGAIAMSEFYSKRVDSPAPPPDPVSVSPAPDYYSFYSVNTSHEFTMSANYYGTWSTTTNYYITQISTYSGGSPNFYRTHYFNTNYWAGYYVEWEGTVTYTVAGPYGYESHSWTILFIITHGMPVP